ncbi:MAG: bestrophin family protein [Flavobacteriales bacterium]|nr:bestrophin family protein [Flavobacteriales bacterium]
MIRYNPKDWFGLIFKFHQSDTFRQMVWVMLAVAIYTTVIVYLELEYQEYLGFESTTLLHSLLGFVMGLLLVFRTNTAYDRWWEGRKQWGALVNNTRNFAIKLHAALPKGAQEARTFYKIMIPNYVYAMKEHLREGVIIEELNDSLDNMNTIIKHKHIPNAISHSMYNKLHSLYRKERITGDQLITLDKEIKAFTDIIGACERIRFTPIPFSYSMFLKKFIFAYILTMPFGLVYDFKYWTIPAVVFTLYVFGSLELIAEEIEDPFGHDENDLPTDELAAKIENNIEEIFGFESES